MKKNVLNRAVSLYPRQGAIAFLPFFCTVLLGKWGYPTPENAILHPILHPKASVNTGRFGNGCRKCRIFSKTCFEEKNRRCFGRSKTSDFFEQKYGCFASKVRMFVSKKSDVFVFRNRRDSSKAMPDWACHGNGKQSSRKAEYPDYTNKKRGQLLEPVSLL